LIGSSIIKNIIKLKFINGKVDVCKRVLKL